jgi:hypothetical protein
MGAESKAVVVGKYPRIAGIFGDVGLAETVHKMAVHFRPPFPYELDASMVRSSHVLTEDGAFSTITGAIGVDGADAMTLCSVAARQVLPVGHGARSTLLIRVTRSPGVSRVRVPAGKDTLTREASLQLHVQAEALLKTKSWLQGHCVVVMLAKSVTLSKEMMELPPSALKVAACIWGAGRGASRASSWKAAVMAMYSLALAPDKSNPMLYVPGVLLRLDTKKDEVKGLPVLDRRKVLGEATKNGVFLLMESKK